MSDQSQVLACVLHWGDSSLTAQCVRSFTCQVPRLDVVVIANGVAWKPSEDTDTMVFQRALNGGYAGGMNSGMERALRGDYAYVMLATNDTWFEDPGAVETLREALLANRRAGAAGPSLYRRNPSGAMQLWSTGGHIDWRTGKTWLVTDPVPEPHPVEWLGGSMLLLRAEAIGSVGPLDERFFMYHEEVDWCVRAFHAGWSLLSVPAVRCYEEASASASTRPGLRDYYMTRNRLLFLEKHHAWRGLLLSLVASARSTLGTARAGGEWRPFVWGLTDYAVRRFGSRRGFG